MRLIAIRNILILSAFSILAYTSWRCTSSRADDTSIPDVVDYNYHIRPILSDRCFKCHGPDANKREANLRLDTPECQSACNCTW